MSVLPGTSVAQEATTPTTTTETGEVVSLPQFTVNETRTNAYQSRQALSASRIALPILDIPQTLSVVPKELIEDSQGLRMLDVAKYVTPVQENTLPFGGDRYTIRGFTVSAEFVDGTMISGLDGYSTSQMPYNIERIEIIKGPNAILVPGGSPGGVMNPITKSPIARNAGSVTLEVGQYSPRALSVDYNRVLTKDKKLQARIIAAYWNVDYYIKDQYRRGWELSPSISYQLSPAHKLTVKFDFMQNRETNLGGLPLDPSVPGGGEAKIARGLPRDWQFGSKDIDARHRSTERGTAELLSTLGSHTTSRLFIMGDHVRRRDVGGTSGSISNAGTLNAAGGSINPNTGQWEPGVLWNTAAYNADTTGTVQLVGAANPVTDPSTWIYTRSGQLVYLEYTEAHLKNDYATVFETDYFKSTTLTGFAANTSKVHYKSWNPVTRPSVANNALASITFPGYTFAPILPGNRTAALGLDLTARQNDLQTFVYETLGMWKDRIQVSGGVSRFFGTLSRSDTTGTAIQTGLENSPDYNLTTNATSFGVVVKPIKQVSLFYSRNTTGGAMPGSITINTVSPSAKVAVGGQKEFGVKTEFMGGKITGSIAHFDISQSNYGVTNSEYYSLIAAGRFQEAAALPPTLYMNLKSKGWEFESTAAIGKNLTILANYTSVKVRQPITDVRLRGVPDHSWGLYGDYRFTEGRLKGFGVNVGVDYRDKAAGENATGYTTTRPLPNGKFVPVQPSFFVAARTLVNAGISYRTETWSATLSASNLLDKDYILAAGSRTSVVVGTPRDIKGTITYKF